MNKAGKKPTVLFTLEHKEREFIPKCYLAYKLAKRGFRVYMGSFSSIDTVAKKIGPSIFFHKSTSVNCSEFYKNLGHLFVFMDEEGGITTPRSSTESFCKHRYRTVSKIRDDIVFLPGKRFEKYVSSLPNVTGVDFHVTGWPRVDLWKENFNFLYESEIKKIKNKYPNYFLLITSFGMTNEKTFKYRVNTTQKYYVNLYNHKYGALLKYIDLIKELSVLMDESELLIIRPHPSESLEDWEDITKNLKNVKVIRDGDITPWILASSGVIQYGSTTATQAALNGISCVQFQIDWQDGITDTPSFELCYDAQSSREVYDYLLKNKGKKNNELQVRAKNYLKEEMAFDEDFLAVNKIADVLQKRALNPVCIFMPNLVDRMRPFKQYVIAFFRIILYKTKLFSKKKTIIDKLPGGIKEKEIQCFINLFSESDHDGSKVLTQQVIKDLVCIEADDKA